MLKRNFKFFHIVTWQEKYKQTSSAFLMNKLTFWTLKCYKKIKIYNKQWINEFNNEILDNNDNLIKLIIKLINFFPYG